MYVTKDIDFVSVSTIFWLDFVTVPTVWYFCLSFSLTTYWMNVRQKNKIYTYVSLNILEKIGKVGKMFYYFLGLNFYLGYTEQGSDSTCQKWQYNL